MPDIFYNLPNHKIKFGHEFSLRSLFLHKAHDLIAFIFIYLSLLNFFNDMYCTPHWGQKVHIGVHSEPKPKWVPS